MKKLFMLLSVLLMVLFVTGCKKEEPINPFEPSPDFFITEETKADIEKADEMREHYNDYYTYYVLGVAPTVFEEYIKTLSADEVAEFSRRAEIISELRYIYGKQPEKFESFMLGRIKNYLEVSKLREGKIDFMLSDELSDFDPVKKTNDYMSGNKIIINELVLSDNCVNYDLWNYPMSFTYTYAIKGEVDGEETFKNLTQTFYFEFLDTEEMTECLSVIQ